jgi:uncharacterized membrane protein
MRSGRVVTICLVLAVLNTLYLSWRYLNLKAGCATPGTGLCSLTSYVDCDQVLSTRQARAFYVPNATLGFGFFFGALIFWTLGQRLGPDYRRLVTRTLRFWLNVATVMTLWFFYLLVNLPHLCPLCPWNHLLTWIATVAAWVALGSAEPAGSMRAKPLVALCLVSVAPLFLINAAWFVAFQKSVFAP